MSNVSPFANRAVIGDICKAWGVRIGSFAAAACSPFGRSIPTYERTTAIAERITTRINEQIRISPVRVIGSGGEQLGILPVDQALTKAREADLDLVEVAPNERPPVCRPATEDRAAPARRSST